MVVATCRHTIDMFSESGRRPRRSRRIMMHVEDAGVGMIRFRCSKCEHDTDWLEDTQSITDNRRGIPCPRCNGKDA